MGKRILVISPTYLSTIDKQALKYSFDLQGYGTFQLALQNLKRVDWCNLLGVAFVSDRLPKGEEFKRLISFCSILNKCGSYRFVFVTREVMDHQKFAVLKQYSSLDMRESSGHEYISDTVIHRQVFGSLLNGKEEMYKLKDDVPETLSRFECPVLHLHSVINGHALQCISDIDALDSLQHTLEFDRVYQQYLKDKSVLAGLRKIFIAARFNEVSEDELVAIERKFKDLLLKGTVSTTYLAIYEEIKERVTA